MSSQRSLNHVTFSVGNLEDSFAFYTGVLEFKPVAKWPEGAYLRAGKTWIALVVDDRVRSGPLPEYSHVAFSCSQEEFPSFVERVKTSGAVIWQENQTQGDSLYFLDPNGHKLELHVSGLSARLESARKNPWEGLVFYPENF